MKRVKTYTDSGVVREVKVFNVADRTDVKKARPPRPRFKDEAEREAHKMDISRWLNARLVNGNFGPGSYYGTYTMDDEHEVHDFPSAKRIRRNYIKAVKRLAPNAKIMMYIGRGKSTHRIHFHILCDGVPKDVLLKLWRHGEVKRLDHLRAHNTYNGIDHGQDYTGLANYLFNHWTPEQGGRRWAETRNLIRPVPSRPVEVKREYSERRPPSTPKGYMLVESKNTKYGYCYFKYVRIPVRVSGRRQQP